MQPGVAPSLQLPADLQVPSSPTHQESLVDSLTEYTLICLNDPASALIFFS